MDISLKDRTPVDPQDVRLDVQFELGGEGHISMVCGDDEIGKIVLTPQQFETLGHMILGHIKGAKPMMTNTGGYNVSGMKRDIQQLRKDRLANHDEIRRLQRDNKDLVRRSEHLRLALERLGSVIAQDKNYK